MEVVFRQNIEKVFKLFMGCLYQLPWYPALAGCDICSPEARTSGKRGRYKAYRRFEELAQRWDRVYSRLTAAWWQALLNLLAFMILPFPIRANVTSTNALEQVNKELKRCLKNKEQFPNEG